MNLSLSEEQLLIKSSAEKFFNENLTFDKRNKAINKDSNIINSVIKKSKELGWYELPFKQKYGGLDGSITDVMSLIEVFGSSLHIDPYIFTVLFPGMMIESFCNENNKPTFLKTIMEAEEKIVFCHAEPKARFNYLNIKTEANFENNKYYLNGKKIFTINGGSIDFLIVSAKLPSNEVGIFLIDINKNDIFAQNYKTINDFNVADFEFNNTELNANTMIGKLSKSQYTNKIEYIYDYLTLACCSDALGIAEKIYTLTLEYVKTREQFGKKIGSFQVIQHRMVDMYIKKEEMRSLNYMAQLAFVDKEEKDNRVKNVSLNKIFLGTKATEIAQDSIQIHGGMGVADEMQIGHYFKRLTLLNSLLGDTDFHYNRYDLYDKI